MLKMLNDLKSIYDSYDEVEPFVGGILEDDAEGAIIGPVFQAIIGEQFSRLQQGDRFYYELGDQAYPFTPGKTFSKIIKFISIINVMIITKYETFILF